MGGSRGGREQGSGPPPGTLQVAKGLVGNSAGTEHPDREAIVASVLLIVRPGGGGGGGGALIFSY